MTGFDVKVSDTPVPNIRVYSTLSFALLPAMLALRSSICVLKGQFKSIWTNLLNPAAWIGASVNGWCTWLHRTLERADAVECGRCCYCISVHEHICEPVVGSMCKYKRLEPGVTITIATTTQRVSSAPGPSDIPLNLFIFCGGLSAICYDKLPFYPTVWPRCICEWR